MLTIFGFILGMVGFILGSLGIIMDFIVDTGDRLLSPFEELILIIVKAAMHIFLIGATGGLWFIWLLYRGMKYRKNERFRRMFRWRR